MSQSKYRTSFILSDPLVYVGQSYLRILNREEMQGLFDPHIKSMLKKIREQLDFAHLKASGNPQVVSGHFHLA